MESMEYFTMPGHYWVWSCQFMVGFYWTGLERDSDDLGSLNVLLIGLEEEIFKIVADYPQVLECIVDHSQCY